MKHPPEAALPIFGLIKSAQAGAIVLFALSMTPALAQLPQPPANAPAAANPRAQMCARLEGQLAIIDRGGAVDPRGDQTRRLEEAINRQQGELDRLTQASQRLNCGGGGFPLFNLGQSPQCGGLSTDIQRARSELERMRSQARQVQGGGGERDERRRAVLVSLAQNECGPQYRIAAASQPRSQRNSGGFLENLFGTPEESGGEELPQVADVPPASTYRTLCVRTCDGFFFPISYATVPSRIATDARSCQRLCPAAEAVLYSHRNPGEDVSAAVSPDGRSYRELPNAFRFRQAFDPSCTCKQAGQSWAEAVTEDETVQRGDVVVKEGDRQASPVPRAAPKPAQKPAPQPRAQPRASAQPAVTPVSQPSTPANGPRNVGTPYYR